MNDQAVTVLKTTHGQYAIRDHTPLEALKLADTASILKLHDGNEALYIRSATVTHAITWDTLPAHHGRTWRLTDASKGGRPATRDH